MSSACADKMLHLAVSSLAAQTRQTLFLNLHLPACCCLALR